MRTLHTHTQSVECFIVFCLFLVVRERLARPCGACFLFGWQRQWCKDEFVKLYNLYAYCHYPVKDRCFDYSLTAYTSVSLSQNENLPIAVNKEGVCLVTIATGARFQQFTGSFKWLIETRLFTVNYDSLSLIQTHKLISSQPHATQCWLVEFSRLMKNISCVCVALFAPTV